MTDQPTVDPLSNFVIAYREAKAVAPPVNEANRKKKAIESYIRFLDEERDKEAIAYARAQIADLDGLGNDAAKVRQTIKSVGRVLKNHGLIDQL